MKIAVIFPGIGYHTDKPILYYAKDLAACAGYEIVEVPYSNFPTDVKGSEEKMQEAFFLALEQAEEILKDVHWEEYGEVLFISKSIGTAVAAAYAGRHKVNARHVFYTPVEQSFRYMNQPGIVFHGTKDGWADTENVQRFCEVKGYSLYVYEEANHSLETGDTIEDIRNLLKVMEQTYAYIREAPNTYAPEDEVMIYEQLSLFPPKVRELTEQEKREYDALAEGAEQMVLF